MKTKAAILLAFILLLTCQAHAGDFEDNGDGTVADFDTGIVWQQADSGETMPWQEALDYCKALFLADNNDWRLPNIKELESLTDTTMYFPAVDETYFPGTNSLAYWASTTHAYLKSNAWLVDFIDGNVSILNKTANGYARCVR